MPPAQAEIQADVSFYEDTIDGLSVSIGVAQLFDNEVALRIYLEQEQGTPYVGPLDFVVENEDGQVAISLPGPLHPRSVPKPTLYETRLDLSFPASIVFSSGPMEGRSWTLPHEQPPYRIALFGPAAVVGIWLLMMFTPKERRHDPQPDR